MPRGWIGIAVVSGILADARGQRGGWWTGRRQEVRAYDKFQGRNSLPSIYDLYPPRAAVHIPAPPEQSGALQVDVEATPDGLRRAAAAVCSPKKQLVLLTSDIRQLDLAANLVANLVSVGAPHYLMLGSDKSTCEAIKGRLACVWSSLMEPFDARLRQANTNQVRAQWLIRQIYVGRMAAMGFSPMLLDADVAVFANPFTLIDEHLPGYQAYFLGDSSAGWLSINGGTLYLREAHADGPVVRIWREFERRVWKLVNTTEEFPRQLGHKTKRGWIGEGLAADALLYDQNVLDWAIVGELTGDREYIGRGFVTSMRHLSTAEQKLIVYHMEQASVPTPAWMGQPETDSGVYSGHYTLRSIPLRGPPNCTRDGGAGGATGDVWARRAGPCGPAEAMLKAPPWLFSAESDLYPPYQKMEMAHPRPERVIGTYWGVLPPVTCLVHFVCTRWPGSEGRKIGMRLLRKWYRAEVARVVADAQKVGPSEKPRERQLVRAAAKGLETSFHKLANLANWTVEEIAACLARKDPKCSSAPPSEDSVAGRMLGFKGTIPLGDSYREPAARCGRRLNCAARWRRLGTSEYDKDFLVLWHRLLGVLSYVSGRTAVLPLFECTGTLDQTKRNAWVVHVPRNGSTLTPDSMAEHARKWAPACSYRIGEGCFQKVSFPEDLASTPPSETITVRFDGAEFAAGGVPALLRKVLAAGAMGDARAVVVDIDDLARTTSEDALKAKLDKFLIDSDPSPWVQWQRDEMGKDKQMKLGKGGEQLQSKLSVIHALRPVARLVDRVRGQNSAPGRRLSAHDDAVARTIMKKELVPKMRVGRAGKGGSKFGGGLGGTLAEAEMRKAQKRLAITKQRQLLGLGPLRNEGFSRNWESRLLNHLCAAMLRLGGQPHVC
jgi:hypothetical protein